MCTVCVSIQNRTDWSDLTIVFLFFLSPLRVPSLVPRPTTLFYRSFHHEYVGKHTYALHV